MKETLMSHSDVCLMSLRYPGAKMDSLVRINGSFEEVQCRKALCLPYLNGDIFSLVHKLGVSSTTDTFISQGFIFLLKLTDFHIFLF